MGHSVIIFFRIFPLVLQIIVVQMPFKICFFEPVFHSKQQKVNVGEMEINPEKLDIVLHSAALFTLLKAKANSLLQLREFPNADAVLYSRCAMDAITLSQMAKCVVPLIRARDQMEEFGSKRREQNAEGGKMKMESAKSETDWMGWPHRLGKWLLDKIVAGDGLLWKKRGETDEWKNELDMGRKKQSENIIRKFKWQKKKRMERPKRKGNAAKRSLIRKGQMPKPKRDSMEALKEIIRMRRDVEEETGGRLMKHIAKLKRIQHFFEMVDHCKQYMDRMGEANSDFISQLPSQNDGHQTAAAVAPIRAVHFRTLPTQLDSLADELQRLLRNYTFSSLPILSPRIFPLLAETHSANDGPKLLSPTVFSFHNEGIFSLPSLFGLIATRETDLVELLDLFLELAGATSVLDKIEAQIASRQSVVENELYPMVLKLEKVERKWEKVSKTFTKVQRRHLNEFGYTLLENNQFRRLYGTERKDLKVMDESKLEEDILRIANIEEHGRKVVKRQLDEQSDQPAELLFRVHGNSSSKHSEDLPQMTPFLFTNKLRQGPVVVNGAVLAPRAFFSTLSSPNFMTISLLSPTAFSSSIMSPRAMATSILSPTAFTANVLNPTALWSEVLSPKFFHSNVLSPRALAALVLSPRTMLGEVLSPKLIEARVLNPGTFFIGVLGPNILQARVLSPSNFGITVLNPNILSPSILSKGNFTVQVLSPSIMSDDVTPEQFLRGQWQKPSNSSLPSAGG